MEEKFANYLLCHSLRETFAIQAISYIKIPAKIKVQENIREYFQIYEIHELFLLWTVPNIQ